MSAQNAGAQNPPATPAATLITRLAAEWPPAEWRDVTVLVAVSGGADSVALARGLWQLRVAGEGRLALAHFNHKLRGAESDADQQFVAQLAQEFGCELLTEAAPSPSLPLSASFSEAALRDLRYDFLKRAAGQSGARYVATAHTADDQVETVLFNMLRGTGLAGLAGIPRTRQLTEAATLIRPLLGVTRMEVIDYLMNSAAPFREDATNTTANYTRNRIRRELLPQLERQYNPKVREALARLSRIAVEAEYFVASVAGGMATQLLQPTAEGIDIPCLPLARLSDFLAREVIRQAWRWQDWPEQDMGYDEWQALALLARARTFPDEGWLPPRMFPGGIRAERRGGMLRLTRASGTDL
jgi:tRNA(Ile)-lysidine synthase